MDSNTNIFWLRISRRSFLRHVRNQALMLALFNVVQLGAGEAKVSAGPSSVPYGSGNYGSLSYGQPEHSESPTIYLPVITKER